MKINYKFQYIRTNTWNSSYPQRENEKLILNELNKYPSKELATIFYSNTVFQRSNTTLLIANILKLAQ